MLNRSSYWLIAGISLGIAAGVLLDNVAAATALGTIVGLLAMLINWSQDPITTTR